MKPTPEDVHEAMQSAPFDGLPFRQARAAVGMIADRVAELEHDRDEMLGLLGEWAALSETGDELPYLLEKTQAAVARIASGPTEGSAQVTTEATGKAKPDHTERGST